MIEVYSTDTDAGLVSVARRNDSGGYELVDQISVGNAPRGSVRFTKNGRAFVSNCGGNTISEIDVLTHREIGRITVGIAPRGIGIIPGDHFALVSNSGEDTVSVVDLRARRELYKLAVGRDPRHMAVASDGSCAYIAIYASHYIAKVATECLAQNRRREIENEVVEQKRIPVGEGTHPYSVALHEESHRLYTANTLTDYVSVIDTESDELVNQIDVGSIGGRAMAFSPDRRFGLLTLENAAEVAVIDLERQEVIRRIPVGSGPRGIAVLPDPFTVFVAPFPRSPRSRAGDIEFRYNALTVVRLGSEERLARDAVEYSEIPVGKGPCSVAIVNTDDLHGLAPRQARKGQHVSSSARRQG
jgi:YVTN family beta-propeller protein